MEKAIARILRVVLVLVMAFAMMPVVPGAIQNASATTEDDVLSVNYNAKMAFDCQRYPAVPEKGNIEIVGRRYRR